MDGLYHLSFSRTSITHYPTQKNTTWYTDNTLSCESLLFICAFQVTGQHNALYSASTHNTVQNECVHSIHHTVLIIGVHCQCSEVNLCKHILVLVHPLHRNKAQQETSFSEGRQFCCLLGSAKANNLHRKPEGLLHYKLHMHFMVWKCINYQYTDIPLILHHPWF